MANTVGSRTQAPASISLSEALELTLHAGENVDGHWRQFYTFLFGLAAWFSSSLAVVGRNEAWIISFATAAFFAVNAVATARAYVILRLLILEAGAIAENTTFASNEVEKAVKRGRLGAKLPYRITMTVLGHIVASAAIIQLMWKAVR